ncbi:hypothetical protein [Haloarcula amylovorans]|uniref:hypothetical protein n=1 Tax=Haloarcula amylovorans TaxID=2562280 RepID=UPI0010760182|nr:hypothetical protein [Halomicroarcula amylolytica]
MQRRSLLKSIGGIGAATAVGGAGLFAATGSAAAATVNISASNPAQVKNDRGDISEVSADPMFDVEWENLDDAVGKVFYLVEAKVGGGDWSPIFRATPWIAEELNNGYIRQIPGTTGRYQVKVPLSQALNQDSRFDDGSGPDASAGPLIVADEQGRPDYSSLSFPSGVDLNSFLDGTSIGSAGDYPGAHEQGGHQNNYPDINAGYYGAADDTSVLDNPDDGTPQETTVQLRYTFELQRPNLSQLSYLVDFSGLSTDAEKKAKAADELDWLEESDIDAGNSKIVMNGEDGNFNFGTPSGIPYADLRGNAENHVGILSTTAAFNVKAVNEQSDSGVTGSSNPDAS